MTEKARTTHRKLEQKLEEEGVFDFQDYHNIFKYSTFDKRLMSGSKKQECMAHSLKKLTETA